VRYNKSIFSGSCKNVVIVTSLFYEILINNLASCLIALDSPRHKVVVIVMDTPHWTFERHWLNCQPRVLNHFLHC